MGERGFPGKKKWGDQVIFSSYIPFVLVLWSSGVTDS